MLYFSKSVSIKKQTHLHLGWPESESMFSKMFIFACTIPLNSFLMTKTVTCVSVILNVFLRRRLEHSHKTMSLLRRCRVQPCSEHPAFFSALSLHGGLDLEPAHRAGIHAVLGLLGQNSTASV